MDISAYSAMVSTPNTGDTTNIILPTLLAIGALLILIFLVFFMKKSNKNDKD